VDTDANHAADTGSRRSDRWAAEPTSPSRNPWPPLAAVLVLAAYGLAAVVVSAARGSFELSDGMAKGVIAATPGLAALGSVVAFVGTRRPRLRALGWVVVVLGAILVLVSIAAVAWVLLAFRSFD
jgi:hypothetical protein